MAVAPSPPEKAASRRSKSSAGVEPLSALRTIRLERGWTQAELADRAGMHRNSIYKLEKGSTKEITAENAHALAAVLNVPVSALELPLRSAAEARSIRFRRLTPEQRQIVDELLSLPPEDYRFLREAIERLRMTHAKKRARAGRR